MAILVAAKRLLLLCLVSTLCLRVAAVITWSGGTTTLTIDASDSTACDEVTVLQATGTNVVNEFSVTTQTPNGNFDKMFIGAGGRDVYVLQCDLSTIIANAVTVYTLTLSMGDGTETATQDFSIAVTNLAVLAFTSPLDGAVISIDESISAGTSVVGLAASKGATTTGFTFSTTSQFFDVVNAELQTGTSSFDQEKSGAASSYSVQLSVTDGSESKSITVTVTVNDENDNPPTFTNTDSNFVVSVAGGVTVSSGTVFGTITVTDADKTAPNRAVSFSMTGTTLVDIDMSSGELTLLQDIGESDIGTYSATVTATNGQIQATKQITIEITASSDEENTGVSSFYTDVTLLLATCLLAVLLIHGR